MRDLTLINEALDLDALRRVCLAPEKSFGDVYDMSRVQIDQPGPEDYYFYRDNGSNILAVAHLDTVVDASKRRVQYFDTEDGKVIQSGSLDDRLGAYIILELLPRLGLTFDVLLTVGEESGCSTAAGFTTDKTYDWIIEFDRGGMDVVSYDYADAELVDRIESVGALHAPGIFSDISYMEHVGVKAMNWGVAYHDYHGPNGYAYLDETMTMVSLFLDFHRLYGQVHMPHTPRPARRYAMDDFADSWIGGGYRRGPLGVEGDDPWMNDDNESLWADDELEYGYYDEDGFFWAYDEDDENVGPLLSDDDVIPYPTPEQLRQAARLWT